MPETEVRFQTKYSSKNPLALFLIRKFQETIVSLVKEVNPKTVLDVGCGEGIIIRTLLHKFGNMNIEGVDAHVKSLEIAKSLNPLTQFLGGSISSLPLQDDSYDLVLCNEVLEHLQEPGAALREVNRVSRKFILLSVPNEPLWRMGNMLRFKYWSRLGNTPAHLQHWTPFAFRAMVSEFVHVVKMKIPILWTMLLCEKKISM